MWAAPAAFILFRSAHAKSFQETSDLIQCVVLETQNEKESAMILRTFINTSTNVFGLHIDAGGTPIQPMLQDIQCYRTNENGESFSTSKMADNQSKNVVW